MDKKYIVANWKMKPETAGKVTEILSRADDALGEVGEQRELSLIFCPPFVFLDEVAGAIRQSHLLHEAELGAQDVAIRGEGALTGEVSGPQLVQSGVRYVIVGHSERRYQLGEDDGTVNRKLHVALQSGLVPIVCVGEPKRDGSWEEALREQVRGTFQGLERDSIGRCLVAYEPVWAISTNPNAEPDTPESALESINFVRSVLAENAEPKVLYGGSVDPGNVAAFLSPEGIDGVLVGGASVRPDDFASILRQAAALQ